MISFIGRGVMILLTAAPAINAMAGAQEIPIPPPITPLQPNIDPHPPSVFPDILDPDAPDGAQSFPGIDPNVMPPAGMLDAGPDPDGTLSPQDQQPATPVEGGMPPDPAPKDESAQGGGAKWEIIVDGKSIIAGPGSDSPGGVTNGGMENGKQIENVTFGDEEIPGKIEDFEEDDTTVTFGDDNANSDQLDADEEDGDMDEQPADGGDDQADDGPGGNEEAGDGNTDSGSGEGETE